MGEQEAKVNEIDAESMEGVRQEEEAHTNCHAQDQRCPEEMARRRHI